MAKELDKRVTTILKDLGFTGKECLWDCHGTWVMYHRYIEIAGAKKKVNINQLEEIETNSKEGIVCIKCYASLKDMKVITYGEASPKNSRNAYPYAMAEKRAIDRAILKLIGLHGFIYSEDELDVKQTSNAKVGASDDEVLNKFQEEIKNSKSKKALLGYGKMYKVHMAKARQSSHAIYLHTKTLYENKLGELNKGEPKNV